MRANYPLRRLVALLLVVSVVVCWMVLFGTEACRHPIGHLFSAVWSCVAVPSIVMAWIDHLHPELVDGLLSNLDI